MKQWRANGKLLLSSEYFVLEGATALAVPTRMGQEMSFIETADSSGTLSWQAVDASGRPWLEAHFNLPGFHLESTNDPSLARRLQHLLKTAFSLDSTKKPIGGKVITRLEFPREWGLGSSSTLVWLVSKWIGVDPFKLQFATFGGSGYDVACAGASGPIFYKIQGRQPVVELARLAPPFAHQLFFLWLGKKQDTQESIAHFRELTSLSNHLVEKFSRISQALCEAQRAREWKTLIEEHETLISKALRLPKVKDLYFEDFPGAIKSLGAWGGDFVLVLSPWPEEPTRQYFDEKGFSILIPWKEMVLPSAR